MPASLPLLVDADTGWGGAFNIARTVRSMIKAGAAGLHIEDQVQAKRCGHRPGKELVSREEMVDRIKAAVDARTDPDFVIMARTDALASEGLDGGPRTRGRLRRGGRGHDLSRGGDRTCPCTAQFRERVGVPVLANITEFGRTPLYHARRTGRGGCGHRAALLLGLPGDERGGAEDLRDHPPHGQPARGGAA